VRRATDILAEGSSLLILGAVISLLWANIDRQSYSAVAHGLEFPINGIGMAFFFALAAKEVTEAAAPGGPLHSPRRAALPLTAALGGMIAPAALFIWFTISFDRPDLERGWAIPCATDIAFSYLAARFVFGTTHPAIPFLLLLAIADDAMGLLIIAAFFPTGPLSPIEFAVLVGSGMVSAWWMRKRAVLSFWPYLGVSGLLSWIGFLRGGLHPALALVPIIPFLPHAARDAGLFVDVPGAHDTLSEFERRFRRPVDVMLFFFAFTNAGVTLGNMGAGTWFVLGSILVGKPVGILAAAALSVLGGLRLPPGLGWRDLVIVGVEAGIGFTVALFFATAAFPYGRLLDETKMGALLSCLAVLVGAIAARALGVGRFAPAAAKGGV
jgi:NhaA family Na+:H+ antiporter